VNVAMTLRRGLVVLCAAGAYVLQGTAVGADVSGCLQFTAKPDGSAAISNVCSERVNFSYCIDSPSSSRPCMAQIADVVTLGPGENESLAAYQAEGSGRPRIAACPYEYAPDKWNPLEDAPVACKKTCVMC